MEISGSYEKGSRGDTRLGLYGAVKYSGDTRTVRIVGFVESTRMGFLFIYIFFIVRGSNAMYLPTSRFVFETVQLRCDKRSM